jgi:hypothetical protein
MPKSGLKVNDKLALIKPGPGVFFNIIYYYRLII